MSQAEVAGNDPRGGPGSDPSSDPSSDPKDEPRDDRNKRDSMRRERAPPCSAFAGAFTAQQTQILALNSDCPAELVGALTLL
jgi:hypothetical protein